MVAKMTAKYLNQIWNICKKIINKNPLYTHHLPIFYEFLKYLKNERNRITMLLETIQYWIDNQSEKQIYIEELFYQ